jgi:hypothetical protein
MRRTGLPFNSGVGLSSFLITVEDCPWLVIMDKDFLPCNNGGELSCILSNGKGLSCLLITEKDCPFL